MSKAELFQRLYQDRLVFEFKDNAEDYLRGFHFHSGYEVVRVLEGDACFIIEGQMYRMRQGSLLVFRGDAPHKIKLNDKSRFVRQMIHFLPEYLPDWKESDGIMARISRLTFPHHHIHLAESDEAECGRIFHALSAEYDQSVNWERDKALRIHMQELLLFFCRRAARDRDVLQQKQESGWSIALVKLLEHLNAVWHTNRTLDDIAGELYMSKYYLCHCFKKEMGISIQQYLMRKRIHEAQSMLLQSELSIKEIGYKVGFQTPSHFIKKFKEIVHATPNQFRDRVR